MRGCTHRTHKRNNHPLKMLPSCLLLLLCLLPLGVLARPQVQPETETGAAVGAWLVDNEGKEVLVKLPTESGSGETTTKGSALQEEESKDSDFLTESYSIVDLFPSSSS